MDRKGIDLLSKGMVPRYDWLRAEVVPMNGLPADATDETNEVIQSDDNDDGGVPGNQVISSSNNQNSTSDDPISEGEGFRDEPSNSEEDPQSGPEGQQN